MRPAEPYEYREFVDFLIDEPGGDSMRWAGAFVMNALRTGGECRYRHGERRLGGAERIAREALSGAVMALPDGDRALFLRVLLLVPWERHSRDTGLRVGIGEVIDVMRGSAGDAELSSAVGAVIGSGVEAVKGFPTDGLLLHERRPGTEIVFELDEDDRRRAGVTSRRVVFDRLDVAVSNFRPHAWESNLRALVPWWLDSMEADAAGRASGKLVAGARRGLGDDAGTYRLLGLIDWMAAHPDHRLADEVLGIGLEGRAGNVRKAAAALAAALGRTEVLERLMRDDPDKGVRKRAGKLLDAVKEPRLL
jgi:hypothetical protein